MTEHMVVVHSTPRVDQEQAVAVRDPVLLCVVVTKILVVVKIVGKTDTAAAELTAEATKVRRVWRVCWRGMRRIDLLQIND